ncbi:Signal transduction histidine kinase [Mycobacterium tuberculosis]|nr:Signal transduction histidine kinase [Mycobacterium tuberculosis]
MPHAVVAAPSRARRKCARLPVRDSAPLAGNGDVNAVALFMLTGWVVAVVALGGAWHGRLAYLREAEHRAAGEERLRIAGELHDVVGHHLPLINVQAGTSLHRFHRDPAPGEAALAAIKESSRDAPPGTGCASSSAATRCAAPRRAGAARPRAASWGCRPCC